MRDEETQAVIEDHESRLKKLEEAFASLKETTQIKEKRISIKEFLMTKNVKSDADRLLVIAYFLEKYDNMNSFNSDDLRAGFQKAREATPTNINARANDCVSRGLLMEAPEQKESQKAWMLTNTGEKLVDTNFTKKS